MRDEGASPEPTRLEGLWAGQFGDAYVERNRAIDEHRAAFWARLLATYAIRSVLEIGCGQGGNLAPISQILDPHGIWGVDINDEALSRLRINAPRVNAVAARARQLPFRDGLVDLAFTAGVLIHQPEITLPIVMAEAIRCSRRYILWIEYYAPRTEEVAYRDQPGSLFRRDYGRIYRETFPELETVEEGFLAPEDGFDRGTWELLQKT
jgi:spore coat polysaccharide biosynthesis protein SpsF